MSFLLFLNRLQVKKKRMVKKRIMKMLRRVHTEKEVKVYVAYEKDRGEGEYEVRVLL